MVSIRRNYYLHVSAVPQGAVPCFWLRSAASSGWRRVNIIIAQVLYSWYCAHLRQDSAG